MPTQIDLTAGLSPDLPQMRARLQAQGLAEYLRRLDGDGFARLLGACQAEASERGMLAAVPALGDAQSAAEDFAREHGHG